MGFPAIYISQPFPLITGGFSVFFKIPTKDLSLLFIVSIKMFREFLFSNLIVECRKFAAGKLL